MAANIELHMHLNGIDHHVLSIPVATCQSFSVHPLSWLRYLGFTIQGSEGHIHGKPNGQVVDYLQTDLQPGVYHYIAQDSFLLDPDLMDDRHSDRVASDASIPTDNRRNFRDEVIGRDGICLVSGISEGIHMQACHIVTLRDIRHEEFNPSLDSINDVRNGLLLFNQLHTSFGASEVAFLQTILQWMSPTSISPLACKLLQLPLPNKPVFWGDNHSIALHFNTSLPKTL